MVNILSTFDKNGDEVQINQQDAATLEGQAWLKDRIEHPEKYVREQQEKTRTKIASQLGQ